MLNGDEINLIDTDAAHKHVIVIAVTVDTSDRITSRCIICGHTVKVFVEDVYLEQGE
jgi:hypothetical protein